MLCSNARRKRVAFYTGQLHFPIPGASLECQTGDSTNSRSSMCHARHFFLAKARTVGKVWLFSWCIYARCYSCSKR